MKCKNCGNEVQENWKMCPFCGSQIEKKKLCAKCGAELQPNWAMCPFCGEQVGASTMQTTSTVDDSILPSLDDILPSDSDLDLVAGDIAEAKQREQAQANAEYQKKLSLARIACIRKNFGQANGIYEELIADNPEDINAYIGFVRIESQNYTQYQGSAIDEAIGVVEQVGYNVEESKLDKEYCDYLAKRKAEFAKIAAAEEKKKKQEAERKAKAEAERKAKEEAERKAKLEAERKAKALAELRAKQEAECKAKLEAERKAKAEAERKAREEAERRAKALAEIRAKAEAERQAKEEIARKERAAGFDIYNGVLRKYIGVGGSVVIPNSVTSIGNYAFKDCRNLTSVTIPNSVTSTGDYAFEGCKNLTSVTIPNSVTSIGNFSFCGCTGLTSIKIPNSVTFIANGAFRECENLTSVIIPDGVTHIGYWAFYGCPLSMVSVDKNCIVGSDAFNSTCKVIYK